MALGQLKQHAFVFEQSLALALKPVLPGNFFGRHTVEHIEHGLDRLRVDIAHQLANVLQLTTPRFHLEALAGAHCIAQIFGQRHFLEPVGRQGHQFGAQMLERIRVLLAAGLARPFGQRIFEFDRIVIGHIRRHLAETVKIIAFPHPPPLSMSANGFSYSQDALREIASDILKYARDKGATACETDVSEGVGASVAVRRSEVDTIEYNRDKGVGVTVYVGRQRGYASTSDFSPVALRATVDAALSIARFTAADDFAGLADRELLATDFPDLDLHHPWDLPVEQAIELARECETAAFERDTRISNSEGASVSRQESHFISANSLGFMGGYASTRHSVSCSVIAGEGDGMQRDYWYDSCRDASELEAAKSIGQTAADRAVARLNGRQIPTCDVPVIFEAPLAAGLIGSFVHAASGGALYRKSTFLLDSLGKAVFSPCINIAERAYIKKGLASGPFDDDGVQTRDRDVIIDGVLQGYFLGVYSARKLGMQTTGNGGGAHNLLVSPGQDDFKALVRRMGRGLVVTELLGHGVNYVTGDYSRGAAGFWVENGEIAYPVEEITIAGNLKDMLLGIEAVGSDVHRRGSKQTGSLLINRMTIAGA